MPLKGRDMLEEAFLEMGDSLFNSYFIPPSFTFSSEWVLMTMSAKEDLLRGIFKGKNS
jgi:hypothetical protein